MEPNAFGDILKKIAPQVRRARKAAKGRALAQKVMRQFLAERHSSAEVVSAKVGVIVIETDCAASFQELEGFEREKLAAAFRDAGLKVAEVRVRLRSLNGGS